MITVSIAPATDGQIEQGDAALATFLRKKKEERMRMAFEPAVESRIRLLDSAMRFELAAILRTPAAALGKINFARSSDATKLIAVNAVVDACRVALEAGCEVTTINSLATQGAVDAMLEHYPSKWSGQRTLMVLVQLQRLITVGSGGNSVILGTAIRLVSGVARRNIDHRVFSPDRYRNSAIALSRVADLLAADSVRRSRVRTLKRDAGLLAVASCGHLRASEYVRLNVGDVRTRHDAHDKKIVTISAIGTKTPNAARGRFVNIRDPQLSKLVLALAEGDPNVPLLRNGKGGRLTIRSVSDRFAIGGVLSVGERASANILRRSRMLGPGTGIERSRDLGQNSPATAERFYKPNQALAGARAVREANVAARRRISEARASSSKGAKPSQE